MFNESLSDIDFCSKIDKLVFKFFHLEEAQFRDIPPNTGRGHYYGISMI